jgi:hypothetical protein
MPCRLLLMFATVLLVFVQVGGNSFVCAGAGRNPERTQNGVSAWPGPVPAGMREKGMMPVSRLPGPQGVLLALDALSARADALEAGEYGCRPAARRLHAAEDALALARTRAERRHAAQEWMRARHGLRRAVR